MTELKDMLTSSNAIIVYIGILSLVLMYIIVTNIIKNRNRRLQRQNTKELNESVINEIKRQAESPVVVASNLEKKEEVTVAPPITIIDNSKREFDIVEELTEEKEIIKIPEIKEEPKTETVKVNEEQKVVEPIKEKEEINNQVVETQKVLTPEIIPETNTEEKKEEELVYAPIELNEEEAKEELEKLTKELTIRAEIERREREEELKRAKEEKAENKNIDLTNFEKEQEENAIISIDELMQKADEIYTQNEIVQYEDEGNEPISIADLQAKWEKEQAEITKINQEELIPKIEVLELEESEPTPVVEPVKLEDAYKSETPLKQVAIPSIITERKEAFKNDFQNSPIISPIYGVERKKAELEERLNPHTPNVQELQLENTANYEKFDEEIKKTNEFIAALKELQKKLD